MFMDNMIAPINVYSIKLKHYLQNMTAERLRYEFKNDFLGGFYVVVLVKTFPLMYQLLM